MTQLARILASGANNAGEVKETSAPLVFMA
jgi:hypothetical protein